jgi:hypothetical protein
VRHPVLKKSVTKMLASLPFSDGIVRKLKET